MRAFSRIRILGFRIFFVGLVITLFIGNVYAEELPDADWMAYFGVEGVEPMEFTISTITSSGPQEFTQRVKPKGPVTIAGKEYRESIVLHDSGPFANRVMKTFLHLSDDRLYERRDDGSEVRLVPRPLTAGQIWANGKETFKLEGIEDFETVNTTVSACLKITVLAQVGTMGFLT